MSIEPIRPLRSADTKLMFCSGKECDYFEEADGGNRQVSHCRRGMFEGAQEEMQGAGDTCPWHYFELSRQLEAEVIELEESLDEFVHP